MRRFLLSAVLLAAVLIIQLTFINGLRLPGGGVPDLVLVVVAALGMTNGPAAGAIAGFAAGFCLDIAPPASGIIGEYALVLCLIGWVCGRLNGSLARSAWLPILITAAAAVVGEVMVAALGMALQPAQVSFASVRAVLPASLLYDVAFSPFVLYLVLLVTARLDEDAAASAGQARLRRARAQGGGLAGGQTTGRQGLAGNPGAASAASGAVLLGLGGWLAGPPTSRRARRAAARHTPRLRSGRPGDGWIGSSASARALGGALTSRSVSTLTGRSGAARLRSGVAGSAAGGQAPRTLGARPVNLRLAAASRRRGLYGAGKPVVIGRGLSRAAMSGLGRRRSRRDGGFRPSALPGGSATTQARSRPLAARTARINFGGGHGTSHQPAGGQGSYNTSVVHLRTRRRMFSRRRRDGVVGGGALTARGRAGGPSAAPRFRIRTAGRSALGSATLASTATLGSGPGSPSIQAFRPARTGRIRMRNRRGDGMLGGGLGSGGRHYGAPAAPRFRSQPLSSARPMSGKRPRFRYRRWTLLAKITRGRAGPHRHLWLIGRIGGGPK